MTDFLVDEKWAKDQIELHWKRNLSHI